MSQTNDGSKIFEVKKGNSPIGSMGPYIYLYPNFLYISISQIGVYIYIHQSHDLMELCLHSEMIHHFQKGCWVVAEQDIWSFA